MTATGIREAFAHLRDGKTMAGLADAARCRSESDWLASSFPLSRWRGYNCAAC